MSRIYRYVAVCVVLVLMMGQPSLCDDDDEDDDEVKGPLFPPNSNGSLFATHEIIEKYGRKAEIHKVTVDDGHILTMFRIVPAKLPASPVLLKHGYLTSSDGWVTDKDSLAFMLSDAGFDVWLTNSRGSVYSREHTKLKPEDKEFWNFSWHEMGAKDVPAEIDHILKTTGESGVHYIGHSLGTTIGFVTLTTQPKYIEKMRSMVCLAPIVFTNKLMEMVGPDGMAEELAAKYMAKFEKSGKMEMFPRKDVATNEKMQISCNDVEENFREMCVDKMEGAQKVLGACYLPAGQSFKCMHHMYQMSVYGKMRHYNYSAEENKKMYGSEEPPAYTDKFKQLTTPMLLWSAEYDQMVVEKDMKDLEAILPNVKGSTVVTDDCFDHVAFLFPQLKSCIPVRAKVYKDIIEGIKKLDKK